MTELPIAVGVCLILGVKFLSEGRNVSLLDGCKRYCGTKINNEIYNCSDVPWRVATYKQKIRATFPIVRIFFMKRFDYFFLKARAPLLTVTSMVSPS